MLSPIAKIFLLKKRIQETSKGLDYSREKPRISICKNATRMMREGKKNAPLVPCVLV